MRPGSKLFMIGGRYGVRAALVLLTSTLLTGACVVRAEITCEDLSATRCGRAIGLTRSALGDRWYTAVEVAARDGGCSFSFRCPNRVHEMTAGKWVSVEVQLQSGQEVIVIIDHRTEPWRTSCIDVIREEHADGTSSIDLEECPSP